MEERVKRITTKNPLFTRFLLGIIGIVFMLLWLSLGRGCCEDIIVFQDILLGKIPYMILEIVWIVITYIALILMAVNIKVYLPSILSLLLFILILVYGGLFVRETIISEIPSWLYPLASLWVLAYFAAILMDVFFFRKEVVQKAKKA